MIRRKATVFRLYPTPDQVSQMAQISGACRFVYNLALEQRREWYRPGRHFTFASQCRELTQLRAEVDWLRAAPIHPLQQALRDLERAYRNWWAGHGRAPRPRKKGAADSFRFPDPVSLKVERTGQSSGRIKLPKLGWVKVRERNWRTLPGSICNITISRRAGQWFAAVQCEQDVAEPAPSALPPVGIDMGIAVFAALSDGGRIAPGNYGKKALRALRTAQRSLSRKRQGSSNRRKAVRRVARVQQRVANARKDFLHKHSTAIAKSHGTVVVEALSVRSMSASAAERRPRRDGTCARNPASTGPSSIRDGAPSVSCWATSWPSGADGSSKCQPPTPAKHAQLDRRCQSPRSGAFRLCRLRTSSRCRR